MLNKLVNYGFVGLIVALSTTYSAVAQQHHQSPSSPAGVTKTMTQKWEDQRFIAMMIHHDQKSIEMADLAVQKAINPEIKTLAGTIKTDQTKEIEQLKALYKQLYGTEVPATTMNCMGMQHGKDQGMAEMMNMESLQNSPDFDKAFLQRMTHHQQMSVMMAQKAINSATHKQLRDLAQDIIKTQTAQIQQLEQLSKASS
jgi:uncharacterized protein (DUF305 family)